MKKNFTESLDSMLLKYSIAASAVILGAKDANAQVVVTNAHDAIVNSSTTPFAIKFNGINTTITIKFASTPAYKNIFVSAASSGVSFRANSKLGAENYIKALPSNTAISAGNIDLHKRMTNSSRNELAQNSNSGTQWNGVSNKFMGVRFKLGSKTYYGWVYMSVASGRTSATIHSYAYNDQGNSITTQEVLPVELTTFTAGSTSSPTGSAAVLLRWNTATEVNNYGFEIQRSEVSAEGGCASGASGQKSDAGQSSLVNSHSSFTKIGFVKGNGNSNSPKDYSFVDDNPPRGTVEYRLKQIDNDGNYKYSQIVTVTSLPTKFELWQNYPNPFNPTTTIQYVIPKAEHVTLKVYDELGKEVTTLVNENKEAGQYRVSFNGSNLASGIYYYRITAGEFTEVKKLMLLK